MPPDSSRGRVASGGSTFVNLQLTPDLLNHSTPHKNFESGRSTKNPRATERTERTKFRGIQNPNPDSKENNSLSVDSEPFVLRKKDRQVSSSFLHYFEAPLRLTAELMILKKNFFPGEYLHFEITLDNCIHGSVRKLKVVIVQKMEGEKNKTAKIVEHENIVNDLGHVGRGQVFWGSELRVPKDVVPSTKMEEENTSQISYSIQFELEMMDGSRGLTGRLPIVILRRERR